LSKKDLVDTDFNSRTIRLLDRLLDGRVRRITPEYDLSAEDGISYPAVNAILETGSQKTIRILNSLHEQGILEREFYDKNYRCPKCGSFQIKLSPSCPNCRGFNLSRNNALEHLTCGHVDFEEEFRKGNRFACPKCRKELRQIGVDYLRVGILHQCRDCKETFHEPLNYLRCIKCKSNFPQEEAGERDIYAYALNESMREKVSIEIRPKRQIEEILRKRGYRIQNSTVEGRSGAKHEFDIFAVLKSGTLEHRIAIGISVSQTQVEPEEVLRLFAKAQDVGAHKIVIIAVPKLSPDAKFFADYYGITSTEARELDRAVKELEVGILSELGLTGETKNVPAV